VLGFFDKLPAFILYFRVPEIAEIFAFMMAFAFLESLLVTGTLALLSVILPSKWLKDGFAYKGLILVLIGTIASIIFQENLKAVFPPAHVLVLHGGLPLIAAVVMIGVVQKMPRVQRVLLNIGERLSIMLFLYVPIGLLSIVVVALGNLL
jgi:hypothetical protein